MMCGRIYRYRSAFYQLLGLVFLLFVYPDLSPAANPAAPPAMNRSTEVVVAHGRGLLPGLEKNLTGAERRTVAHTVALVDALSELATLVAEPSTTRAGSSVITQYAANVGGVIDIAVKHTMASRTLMESETQVSWSAPSEGEVSNRIVLENWRLVSPPVRHLDVYTLLRQVQEAGITIDTWQVSEQGLVNVAVSMPSTGLPVPRPSTDHGLMLLTAAEAKDLVLAEDEWLVPLGKSEETLGPRIMLQRPSVTHDGAVPLIETTSPLALFVAFEPSRAPVDMASLRVRARKGIFKVSLTPRLQSYIRGTSIQAQGLMLPAGKFLIEIDIADREGHNTSRKYYVHVIEP